MIELELKERYPGAIAETKRKAKASIAKSRAKDEFKAKGNYRFGITKDFKSDCIIPDKLNIKKSCLRIPKFDGAHVDLTDEGFDFVVSFR